jgi:DNA-binding PadR family transcriptional regulator
MTKSTINSRYLILGLMTQQAMSGYDIKQALESFSWLIGSPSYGSLYPALHALLEEALVTVDVIANANKPARKIYSITSAGREVLEQWIEQPSESDPSLKAFVIQLLLANNFSAPKLRDQLQQRRLQITTQMKSLEAMTGIHTELTERKLAFDYGLALAQAELTWLDETLDKLS